MIDIFLSLYEEINCPVSAEKTKHATQLIIFLGILLNGKMLVMLVPQEKKNKALNLLQEAIDKHKVTVKFIQKLTGTLNFLNRAIIPGHAFVRGMYQKLSLTNAQGISLKQHHHVTLNADFLMDCMTWQQFLNSQNLGICRPFIDFQQNSTQILNFTSDASRNYSLGMGAVFKNNWIVMRWNKKFIEEEDPSIEFLELFALTAAVTTWTQYKELKLLDRRITIFCDNQAVVSMVNNFASSCPQCCKLICILAITGIRYNLRIFVKFIRSGDNILSDALSRMNFEHFWHEAPRSINPKPDIIDQ